MNKAAERSGRITCLEDEPPVGLHGCARLVQRLARVERPCNGICTPNRCLDPPWGRGAGIRDTAQRSGRKRSIALSNQHTFSYLMINNH